MKRLFLAIPLPEELKVNLFAPLKRMRTSTMKLAPSSQIHITLRFLGAVESDQQREIESCLAELPPWTAFRVVLKGSGLLPSRRQPKILYAGVEEGEGLLNLKASIDGALRGAGVGADGGRFRPHVTVARFRDSAPRSFCDAAALPLSEVEFGAFEVSSFGLYSSQLLPSGAVHSLEAVFNASK